MLTLRTHWTATRKEIQYENFNAAKAEFQVTGVNVHPGSSKDVMVNASLVAMEINSMLPADETPGTRTATKVSTI